jgi:hypothetical protein
VQKFDASSLDALGQIGGNTPLFCFSALEHQRDDAVEEVLLFLPRILAKACSSNLLREFRGWES